MKRLYTFSLFILSITIAKADYWTQKADLPGHKRVLPISFGIGNTGYIGWGTDTSNMSVKDFWAYNANTNSWTQKATFQGAARSGAACFVNTVSGKAYAGLGQNTLGTLYQDWWEYNTATNSWSVKANFPGGPRGSATAFFTGQYGYVGLGTNAVGDQNDLYLYEPVSNSWQAKPPLPSSYGRREVASFVIGNMGYVATGYSTSQGSSLLDLYEFDSSNDTWNQKCSFFGDARFGASAFTVYNHGYVGLGKTVNNTYETDFWVYDPYTDSWYQKADFGGSGRFEGGAFAINDSGYFCSGGSPNFFYRDLWKYTPDTATVGVNEFTNNVQCSIYPNPVKDYCELRIENFGLTSKIEIAITDVKGEKILTQTAILDPQSAIIKIPVATLKTGIYFVSADNGKQKLTRKFLKE